MGFLKKTWVDRISEYPARRRLKKSDGTEEVVTVSREEGTISKEGDAFSAQNMNDLETRVSDAFDEVNNSLEIVMLQTGETYRFFQYGKARYLVLNGMQGNSFLNMNFEKHKPILNIGEMCYYKTPDNKNYLARASILVTGKPSGTIILSESNILGLSSGSSGLLYGTLIWLVK